MKRWIARALNVQPEDLGRGLLLSSCLFLIISSYMIGKVARDALFLARFQAVQLPYADIASGILVGFVVAGYVRLARRTSLRNLLIGSQLFFAANCGVFWVLAKFYHPAWLYPVFYIWVGIFGVLAPTQVWTLANYLLTTREAKQRIRNGGGRRDLGVDICRVCLEGVGARVWHGESSVGDGSVSGDFLRADLCRVEDSQFQAHGIERTSGGNTGERAEGRSGQPAADIFLEISAGPGGGYLDFLFRDHAHWMAIQGDCQGVLR